MTLIGWRIHYLREDGEWATTVYDADQEQAFEEEMTYLSESEIPYRVEEIRGIPVTLRIPLTNIEIDGDRRCAFITVPDSDGLIRTIMAARANPGMAAVLRGDDDGKH